jgi:hypothetical protein
MSILAQESASSERSSRGDGRVVHIHNGDSSANTLMQSGFPGEHLAWHEVLVMGATPAGLTDAQWLELRAGELAESYQLDLDTCRKDLARQESLLARLADYDEVVLWFEHDLYCQTLLIYLLSRLQALLPKSDTAESKWEIARGPRTPVPGHTELSLICINEFPGVERFRGLGQLTAEQMATLYPKRHAVTRAEMNTAASAWAAYCSSDPRAIEDFLASRPPRLFSSRPAESTPEPAAETPLPFLDAALEAHLRRFPSMRNRLGWLQNQAVSLIAEGYHRFSALFRALGDRGPEYGLSDCQCSVELDRLVRVPKPVLAVEGVGDWAAAFHSHDISGVSFALTPTGESVLAGNGDFIALNGINLWLGGVHLTETAPLWRWDEDRGTLVSG